MVRYFVTISLHLEPFCLLSSIIWLSHLFCCFRCTIKMPQLLRAGQQVWLGHRRAVSISI
jgi:hypothetical protein